MIKNLIPKERLHQLSRSRESKEFWIFKEIDNNKLFGQKAQNPINAGSSMFIDTPNLPNKIKEFIEKYFNKDCYIKNFPNEKIIKIAANNLILFKKCKSFRRIVLKKIFIIDKSNNFFDFKENLYGGYLFITICLFFLKDNFNKKNIYEQFFDYYNIEELKKLIINVIINSDNIDNITSILKGRKFFIDYQLSKISDYKPISEYIVEIYKSI
ncbi:hypothetical protein [Nautilia sp.]